MASSKFPFECCKHFDEINVNESMLWLWIERNTFNNHLWERADRWKINIDWSDSYVNRHENVRNLTFFLNP